MFYSAKGNLILNVNEHLDYMIQISVKKSLLYSPLVLPVSRKSPIKVSAQLFELSCCHRHKTRKPNEIHDLLGGDETTG